MKYGLDSPAALRFEDIDQVIDGGVAPDGNVR